MVLDAIVGVSCILALYKGWKKGLVSAILSLIAVWLGIIISLQFSMAFAEFIQAQHIITSKYILPISYIILFIGILLLFRMLIRAIEKVLKMAMLGWANKLAGAILYMLVNAVIFSSILWLSNTLGIITPNAKQSSRTYSLVEPLAPKLVNTSSTFLPFLRNTMQKIQQHITSF